MKKSKYFLLLFLVIGCLTTAITGDNVVFAANTYDDIKTELPDDGSSNNPNNIDNDSHQYISMQDNNGRNDLTPYTTSPTGVEPDKDEVKVANIKLYSKSRKDSDGAIVIRLNYAKRDFIPAVACAGFRFKVDILQFDPTEQFFNNSISRPDASIINPGTSECTNSYTTITIPRSILVKSSVPEHSGLYTAVLRLTLTSNDTIPHSPTFHIKATDGKTRIGYAGSRFRNMKLAIYPSNERNRYRVNFNARPTCDSLSDGEMVTVYWSGANDMNQQRNSFTDRGPSNLSPNFTPGNLSIKMYEIRSDGWIRDSIDISPNQTQASMPYHKGMSYRISFFNVTGGNRIVFDFNHDSGDFGFECIPPTPPPADLKNSSAVNPDQIQYSPPAEPTTDKNSSGNVFTMPNGGITPKPNSPNYSMGMNCTPYGPINEYRCNQWNNYYKNRVTKAQEAFSQASFGHRVGNNGDGSAASGTHNSKIQYRFARANNPATGQNGERDQYDDRFNGSTWTGGLSTGQWADIRPTGWSPNPTTSAHGGSAGAAALINGDSSGYGRPWYGDMYCERAVTNPGNIRSYDGSPPEYCVKLCQIGQAGCGSPLPCPVWPWQLYTDGYIQQRYSSGWSGSLGRSVSDAWVNSTFGFFYTAYKTGPASETEPIESNVGGMNGQRISATNPDDPFVVANGTDYNITASMAGQVIRQQPYFQPTSNDPSRNPCLSGRDEFEMSVTVPHYYHVVPKVSGSLQPQIQQGENISLSASIKNPSSDTDSELMSGDNENGGRGHTYTRDMRWEYVSFKANDINEVQSKFTDNNMLQRNGSDVCNVLSGLTISNFSSCNPRKSGNETIQIETKALSVDSFSSGLEPVGTVICVTIGASSPTHAVGSDYWRIVKPVCTTVVKSPKVQFKYGDVNAGRPRIGVGECKVNLTAKIQATPAPNVGLVDSDTSVWHKYGSWGEYGVFSSGSIVAFGSSGAEANTTDKAKRLTFANTQNPPNQYGSYPYNIKCIPNLMNNFSAEVNNIPEEIYPNEYFTDVASGRNTKSRFAREGNIELNQRPKDEYKAIVTVTGYSDYGEDVQGGSKTPANAVIKVFLKSGDTLNQTVKVDSNNAATPATKDVEFDLGNNGWRGISRVDVVFDNNNGANFRPPMSDRNLYLKTVRVVWQKNNTTTLADTGAVAAGSKEEVKRLTGNQSNINDQNIPCNKTGDGSNWVQENRYDDGRIVFAVDQHEQTDNRGLCYGIYFDAEKLNAKDGKFNDSFEPAPLLNDQYNGFRSRNVIVYAKKNSPNCNGSSGNLYVNLNIDYLRDGYTKLSEIPRFTLMADCNIIIDDSVDMVRASLIAGNEIQTCKQVAKSQDVCNKQLVVKGAIQAKKLSLWRTSGADLAYRDDASRPAETFEYGVDQMMAGYEYGLINPVLKPAYQRDLPPRY